MLVVTIEAFVAAEAELAHLQNVLSNTHGRRERAALIARIKQIEAELAEALN